MSMNKYSNCYFMYKSFLFFRSEELEHLERFELPFLEWKSNTLNQTMLIPHLVACMGADHIVTKI